MKSEICFCLFCFFATTCAKFVHSCPRNQKVQHLRSSISETWNFTSEKKILTSWGKMHFEIFQHHKKKRIIILPKVAPQISKNTVEICASSADTHFCMYTHSVFESQHTRQRTPIIRLEKLNQRLPLGPSTTYWIRESWPHSIFPWSTFHVQHSLICL